jgi:cellulose synthase/poly-beta-1,6-N-acetylglucosamine synthase-like glycosyltransferase
MLERFFTQALPPGSYEKFLESGNLSFLYRPQLFDILILLAYVLILAMLSAYGLRRYYYLYWFKKYRHVHPEPAGQFAELPMVTVQLPMYNEMYVGPRILNAACQLDYPKDKLHIQVLDDSTDETVEIMEKAVEYWVRRGFMVDYIHRVNRGGFKAGAMDNGLKTAKGDIVAIFDADFVPHADFLQRTVHHFTDPDVGIVQTRWGHLNGDYSLLTRCQTIFLDGHFMMESLPRARAGLFVNFNGTAGLWRKQAIDSAGGWHHDTITEDLDLSLRAQMKGWKFVYLPEIECPAELPVEMNAFKSQQNRWAKGSTQVCLKLLLPILRSDLPRRIKTEVFFHLTANLAYPLMILLPLILVPAMIVRFHQGLAEMLFMDLPIFLASTVSVALFYIHSQKALYPDWRERVRLLPFLMALGIGLSVTNGKAVIEALLGIKSSFVRTPKFHVTTRRDKWFSKKYRGKLGFWPLLEIAFGVYFLWVIFYSFDIGNYGVVPFLLLFLVGYFYTGFSSLFHNLLKFPFVDMGWRRLRALLD